MRLDFVLFTTLRIPGVYTSLCRLIPDTEGIFLIKVLNTTKRILDLNTRYKLGRLISSRELIDKRNPEIMHVGSYVGLNDNFAGSIDFGEDY